MSNRNKKTTARVGLNISIRRFEGDWGRSAFRLRGIRDDDATHTCVIYSLSNRHCFTMHSIDHQPKP